jgi:biopolymer transport protein ExbD
MRFLHRKRRKTPTVIIIALIDVLIVVLIFMMVATTFKAQQPAMQLSLPESSQTGTPSDEVEMLIVSVGKEPPHFYLGQLPVTYEALQTELKASAARNKQVSLAIRADEEAAWKHVVRVMDAAREAGMRVLAQTRLPEQP